MRLSFAGLVAGALALSLALSLGACDFRLADIAPCVKGGGHCGKRYTPPPPRAPEQSPEKEKTDA